MTDLSNMTAVVTGGISGIGLAVATELASAGAKLVVNGLGSEAQIKEALGKIGDNGKNPEPVYDKADLRDPDQIKAMIEKADAIQGPLQILVNNAGLQHVDKVEDFPKNKWDDIIAVNLSAAFHASALVLPGMKAQNYGRIINTASAHGLVASKDKAAYVAAKHGIVGLTKVIALENAEANITCNGICPGWVLTPLVQAQIDRRAEAGGVSNEEATKALLSEKQPSLRFTKPEDVAAAVMFILSPAANNMTGTCLMLDGGWTSQ